MCYEYDGVTCVVVVEYVVYHTRCVEVSLIGGVHGQKRGQSVCVVVAC